MRRPITPRLPDRDAAGTSAPPRTSEWLIGASVPTTSLVSTSGGVEDLAALAHEPLVIYLFPGTDTAPPSVRDPDGLLGSGCTMQARAFREVALDFAAKRVRVVGVSGGTPDEQIGFAVREGLPFSLLSDPGLTVAGALGLPTAQERSGEVFQRVVMLASAGIVRRALYPVQIPRRSALDVLDWLDQGF